LTIRTAGPEVVPAQTYDYDELNAYARGSPAAAAETSACGNDGGKTAENGDSNSKADDDVDVERGEGSSKMHNLDDDVNNGKDSNTNGSHE
jgi:hypothetical protein